MSHALKMMIGCVAAFGLLFLLPVLGLGEGATLFGFLVVMFLCHLFMLSRHANGHDRRKGDEP